MKTTRNEHGVLRPTEFTIERPAADGFHTGILATASERLGRMAAKANAASAAGGNGQTLDVDGMVTKDEVVRFAASNTAKPQQHAATLELLKLFEPEVRHVTLPTAHAPVTRERLRGAEPGQDKTRDFVPRQEPQYVATLPLTNARIDLVTSGTLKEAENPGTPRQINLIRRSLSVHLHK